MIKELIKGKDDFVRSVKLRIKCSTARTIVKLFPFKVMRKITPQLKRVFLKNAIVVFYYIQKMKMVAK